jgi:hypothetical protein
MHARTLSPMYGRNSLPLKRRSVGEGRAAEFSECDGGVGAAEFGERRFDPNMTPCTMERGHSLTTPSMVRKCTDCGSPLTYLPSYVMPLLRISRSGLSCAWTANAISMHTKRNRNILTFVSCRDCSLSAALRGISRARKDGSATGFSCAMWTGGIRDPFTWKLILPSNIALSCSGRMIG